MSKIICLTSETLDSIIADFREKLATAKLSDGKINCTRSFDKIERKAELKFAELAWLKMQTLVREYDKEIAWHGIAMRGDDKSKDEYIITDIIVYPQEVTGATVTTDQTEYQTWLYHLDDEVFNNVRMQGHSHVNMGVTPSAVDTNLYESLLAQLDDTMFYIFIIWNKRNEKTIKIYDLAKNVLFETQDVTVSVMDDDIGIEALLRDAKNKVKDKSYNAKSYGGSNYSGGYSDVYGGYSSYSGYGGYSGDYGAQLHTTTPSQTSQTKPTEPITLTPSESSQKPAKTAEIVDISGGVFDNKSKKRKGRRKKDKYKSSNSKYPTSWNGRFGIYD